MTVIGGLRIDRAEQVELLDNFGRLKAENLLGGFGDFFVDYYLKLKQAEIDRFNADVSDWEQREYFSTF